MTRIVCQVLQRPERAIFMWSQGTASYAPYRLQGEHLEAFRQAARLAREGLTEVASRGTAALPALAQAGWQLYRAIFPDHGPQAAEIAEIRGWLEAAGNALQSLEIVSDMPGQVPWQAVYDRPPDDRLLSSGNAEALRPFWGIHYPLAAGRRVNTWRQVPFLEQPNVLFVVDPQLHSSLSADEQQRLAQVAGGAQLVDSRTALEGALQDQAPDLLYVFCPGHADGFVLGNEVVSSATLRALLLAGSPDALLPLVFLNLTSANVGHEAHVSLDWMLSAGIDGLVVSEEPTGPAQANACGLDLLQRFLEEGKPLGKALQEMRGRSGAAGLIFNAYCPPYLRVIRGEAADDFEGPRAEPLPERPYRPLAPFDREDRALFTGRDAEVSQFAAELDRPGTRLMVLHGAMAVGKSSFLRAGVIPYLEDGVGFRAWRDRSAEDTPTAETDYPVIAIRAGSDLAGQLALGLCAFCDQPLTFTTPSGKNVTVNLPAILSRMALQPSFEPASTAVREQSAMERIQAADPLAHLPEMQGETRGDTAGLAKISPTDLWDALQNDTTLLARLLAALSEPLPFELVVVIEQGEELFTQVDRPVDRRRRRLAMEMLARVAALPSKCKVILSLRTDFFGRLASEFAERFSVPAFLLPELTREQLIAAILVPTSGDAVPYGAEVPYEKYRFTFEEGVPATILERIRKATDDGAPLLPAVHAVCNELYVLVSRREDLVIRAADLKTIERGDAPFTLRRYVDRVLSVILRRPGDRDAFQDLALGLRRHDADGGIVRRLVPLADLAPSWRSTIPFQQLVEAASADTARLLELSQMLVGGKEDVHVSLGHDALARVAQDWAGTRKQRKAARTRTADLLWIFIPLLFLVAAVTLYLTRQASAGGEEGEFSSDKVKQLITHAQQLEEDTENLAASIYTGQMSLADQALHLGNTLRLRQILLGHQDNRKTDARGFEWHYLWRQGHQQRQSFVGHTGQVTAVALSPDGRSAASASFDGTVKLWNLASRAKGEGNKQIQATFEAHTGPVHTVAFTSDGKKLLSAGADKRVLLWDIPAGDKYGVVKQPSRTFKGHDDAVLALAVSANKTTFASAGADKKVMIWNLGKDEPERILKDHDGAVRALSFTADGKTLASAGDDTVVHLWDASTGKKQHTLKGHTGPVAALAFAPDGKLLASGGADRKDNLDVGTVRLWDPGTGKPADKDDGRMQHSMGVFALAFLADGKLLATGGKDNLIRFWDPASGAAAGDLKGHVGWVRALAGDAKNGTIVSGSYDQSVKVWDAAAVEPDVLTGHKDWVTSVAFSPDDQLLASGSRDGSVRLWDPVRARPLQTLGDLKGAVLSVVFASAKGATKLAAGIWHDKEGEIRVWDITADKDERKAKDPLILKGHAGGVACVAISPDGKLLASGSGDHTVILWDLAAGKAKQTFAGHKAAVRCVAFSGDGLLISGSDDGTIRVWSLAPGKDSLKVIDANSGPITALSPLSRDLLVVGAYDHTMKVWKIDGTVGAVMRGHSQPVFGVGFSNAGGYLASGSWDHTVKLWAPQFGVDERFTLRGHAGPVRGIAIAGHGRTIASASNDGTVRLWRAAPEGVLGPDH